MLGKTISHYKILAKLGEGGMSSFSKKYNKLIPQAGGVVYKAEDTLRAQPSSGASSR